MAPFLAVLLWCLMIPPSPSHAGMALEIDHLLQYIETSGCTFNRNGTVHDSEEAAAHIRKKFDYAKRWIKSTEDFIRYTATKSSISGQPYFVICNGTEMPTAEWLTDELARFREKPR
jgi:hypothetical protein